jgi:hypoxanthine phosphoribosyltransferase
MSVEKECGVDVLFSEEMIRDKICEVALRISKDFKNKEFLIVAVLNGSFIFCADLVRNLDIKCRIDFISVSSYSGIKSRGKIELISGFRDDIIGKDVLIVEDILDTGKTLNFLKKEIWLKKPRSVATCVLLVKKCARQKEIFVEYSCFEVENGYIVGYGLDYNGFFRGLPYIGEMKEFVQ